MTLSDNRLKICLMRKEPCTPQDAPKSSTRWMTRPLYGCLYNLLMFPLNLVHGVFLELDEEPYFRLAGLLELTYRNSTPPELQTRGLTIRIRDNKAYFCISGSISLADLQTLCERCQAGQSPDQCKK